MSEPGPGRWAPSTHDVVWVDGTDAVDFADGQLSQDVAGMAPGTVARSLLLEPRGKLRAIVWVLRGESAVGLVTWQGTGEMVAADLQRFLFRVDAAVTVDPGVGAAVWGTTGAAPGTWTGERASFVADLPEGSWPATIVVGAEPVGSVTAGDEMAVARIRAGEPVFGEDVDEGTIPQETGLVPEAVSFTKGCYLGQELVARIDTRGHVNRLLRRVVVEGAVPPPGAEMVVGDDIVGALGSVAVTDGGAEALGLVRREVAPGRTVGLRWPGGTAVGTVSQIVHTLRTGGAEDDGDMEPAT